LKWGEPRLVEWAGRRMRRHEGWPVGRAGKEGMEGKGDRGYSTQLVKKGDVITLTAPSPSGTLSRGGAHPLSLITSLNGNTDRNFPTDNCQEAQGSPTTVSA
jgi:hypothetical protein